VYWEHYCVYLVPFWGWLFWEARQSLAKKAAVAAIMATSWVPWSAIVRLKLHEPLNSAMLWGTCLVLILAIARMTANAPSRRHYVHEGVTYT
jgi:hypothetical protein